MGLGIIDLNNLTLDGMDINSIPADDLSIGNYLKKLQKPKKIIRSKVIKPKTSTKIFTPTPISSLPDYNVSSSAFGMNIPSIRVNNNPIVRSKNKGSDGTGLKKTGSGRDDGWLNDPKDNKHMIIPPDIDYDPVDTNPAYVKLKDNFVPYDPVDPHEVYVKPKDNFVPYDPVDIHKARVAKKVVKQVKALNTKAQSAPVKVISTQSKKVVEPIPVKKVAVKERAEAIKNLVKKRNAKKTTSSAVRKKITAKKAVRKLSVAKKAPAKRFATVDPLNIFGNKNGINPFNFKNKGNNRFSGGKVTSSKTKKRKFSADRNLDLF